MSSRFVRFNWALAVVFLLATAPLSMGVESESPTQLVQRLGQTFRNMTPSASPAQRLAAVGTAHALLDIPGVSQRVLGRHWDTCNTDQRQEFTALLTQLLAQVVYPQSAAFFHQLEMRITDEEVKNQSARVRTAVHHPSEGLIEVDYRLRRHQGTWRVSDIILDEVSIATSLRTQVHQIIVRHSYDALLQRMRDKLEAQAPSAQQHATSARH